MVGYNYLKLSNILLKGASGNEPRSVNDLVCKRLCHEFDSYYSTLFCGNDAFTKFAPVERWVIFVHTSDSPMIEALVSAVS